MIKEVDFTYKKGGTTLYFKEELTELVCVDIDIESDSKVAYFCFKRKFDIRLRDVSKQFPWVTCLYIDKTVLDISISNRMFPNVEKILGSSKRYSVGKNVLIDEEYLTLHNTFCKTTGELIDLTGVRYICGNAFEGCMSNNVLQPRIKSMYYFKDALNNFAGELVEKKGVYYIGDLFYDFNYNADVIDLPRSNHLPQTVELSKSEKIVNKLIIHDFVPKFFMVNAKTIYIADDFCDQRLDFLKGCEHFEVDPYNEYFTSIDGIIYSKDKTILEKCPTGKTGTIVIPKGTNIIACDAFLDTSIEKVVLPESVDIIGARAFYGSKLSEIKFCNNSVYIRDFAFAYCQNLSKVEIPANIKFIGKAVFKDCENLERVVLHDGIQEITNFAFQNCSNLRQISIPQSVKRLYDADKLDQNEATLINFDEITIEGNEIPENLIHAVSTSSNKLPYGYCTVIHFNNGKSMCVPKCMTRHNIETISAKLPKTVNEIDEQDIFHLFVYSKNGISKYITALLTYMVNGESDEFTKKYLKKSCSKLIDILAEADKEEMFIHFIKMDVLTKKSKEKAIRLAQDKNWAIALAYLLDSIDDKTNTPFKL